MLPLIMSCFKNGNQKHCYGAKLRNLGSSTQPRKMHGGGKNDKTFSIVIPCVTHAIRYY